jgi:hypothetical protein
MGRDAGPGLMAAYHNALWAPATAGAPACDLSQRTKRTT